MLMKLIKHEFKAHYIMNLIFGGMTIAGALLFAIIVSLSSKTNGSNIDLAMTLLLTLVIPLLIASYIYMLVTIVRSLTQRLFQDFGILFFSIPVKTKDIIISKYIVNFIWFMYANLVMVIAILLMSIGAGGVEIIDVLLRGVASSFGDIVIAIIGAVVYFIYYFTLFFAASALTYSVFNTSKKKVLSVVIFLVVNAVINTVSSFLVIIPYAFTTSNNGSLQFEKIDRYYAGMTVNTILIYALVVVGAIFLIRHLIKNKLEL